MHTFISSIWLDAQLRRHM